VDNGQHVDKAQPLFTLFNPEMNQQLARAVAGVALEEMRRDSGFAEGPAAGQMAESLYNEAVKRRDAMRAALAEMSVEAPFAGLVIAPELDARLGSFIEAGDTLLVLATLDDMVIRAYVDDREFAWLFPNGLDPADASLVRVSGRLYDHPGEVVEFDIDVPRSGIAGARTLPFQSLGGNVEGGGIALDPTDSRGQLTLSPQWLVTLRPRTPLEERGLSEPENPRAMSAMPGTRARLRFSRPPEPLIRQWYRHLRQMLSERFEI